MTDDPSRLHSLEPNQPLTNGVQTKSNDHGALSDMATPAPKIPSTNAPLAKDLKSAMQQLPMDIPQLTHITDGYEPLSRLFERSAQQCFNSLKDTIASTQDSPRSRMVNGTANGIGDDSESVNKKSKWSEFANSNRERFIKLLVLLQWSRSARNDIGQLVDVVSWMRQLSETYDELEDQIGIFKRDMAGIKIPSPDIHTALEVLTTGQSSLMPDLSYLPRKPLSSREVLDTLQNLNTLLHVRLNVYENLPPELRRFNISSGRVTFKFPNEFELDLSIFDEDPSTHFYFLDFRFLFSPASEIPTGPQRNDLELRANSILASEGLVGCYEFFHDFILTYKLSILRQQAFDLARGAWTGALRIERVHRSLVIQYWAGGSQRKSWVEIGIKSGVRRENVKPWKGDVPSKIFIKWVRAGKHIDTERDPIQFDHQDLDVELTLQDVIKRHTRHLLGLAREKFANAFGDDYSSNDDLLLNDEASDLRLSIPLYFKGSSTLRIEPISGSFSLSPKTVSSTRCESALNKLQKPEDELFDRLQAWRSYDGAAAFRASAARSGWQVVESLRLDDVARKQYFRNSPVGHSFIKRWNDPKWVIAATPNRVGSFSLWIFNIQEPGQTLWRVDGYQVRKAFALDTDTTNLSAGYFERLYKLSIATISSYQIRNRLSDLGIPFVPLKKETSSLSLAFPVLSLDVSSITGSSKVSSHLFLCHFGSKPTKKTTQNEAIIHVASGCLNGAADSKALLTPIESPDVKFKPDGTFVIVDREPVFTARVVDKMLRMLRHLVQLQSCLENLIKGRFRISSLTLDSLIFSYLQGSRRLQARLLWSHTDTVSIQLAPRDNPQKRLLPVLKNFLETRSGGGLAPNGTGSAFTVLIRALIITLNLLAGLDAIESHSGVLIEVSRLDQYKVLYHRPRCALHISLRQDRERSWWYIEQGDYSPRTNEKLQAEIKNFMSTNGEGTMGLIKGVAVDPKLVDKVLERLDERIRSCADGEEERIKKRKVENAQSNASRTDTTATSQQPLAKKEKAPPKAQQTANQQQSHTKQTNGTSATEKNGSGNGGVNGNHNQPEIVVLD